MEFLGFLTGPGASVSKVWQAQRKDSRGEEEAARGDQGRLVVVDRRHKAENNRPDRSCDPADIVTEAGARGPQ